MCGGVGGLVLIGEDRLLDHGLLLGGHRILLLGIGGVGVERTGVERCGHHEQAEQEEEQAAHAEQRVDAEQLGPERLLRTAVRRARNERQRLRVVSPPSR